jgi:L,D-transpeptidase ErfK/SrfK
LCRVVLAAMALVTLPLPAVTLPLPPSDIDVVGRIVNTHAEREDTLLDIARRYDIGQDEILLANGSVDRWMPAEGAVVVIPSRFVLPAAKREGIVLNVPEMRLYYFPPAEAAENATVVTHPVSIGRMDWATPLGVTRITSKTRQPSWTPPASIRAEAEASGNPLPEVILPGPDNPLGDYAMRLGVPGYLIHSTNKPFGVGMRVTHGCIRMYPEDIEALFPRVPVGTPVNIVNQPVKIGWLFDTLFIEVHPPLEEQASTTALLSLAMDLIHSAWSRRPLELDVPALKNAVKQRTGTPVPVARARAD